MNDHFTPITDLQTLETLFTRSHEGPVLIFKHSSTCPISSAAYSEMSRLKEEVPLIVVQRSRDLSNKVEERTGVRHESPQAIILRNGQAVWSASHFSITADSVERAFEEHR